MGGIIVRPRARILHGHDWVYGTEVLKSFGSPVDGDIVSIKDGRDRMLGSGVYNSKSQIVVRRFSRRRQELDAEFFTRRLERAQQFRDSLGVDPMVRRVVWSESDGLPGVIVDRFGPVATLQTLTMAMDQRREMIADTNVNQRHSQKLASASVFPRRLWKRGQFFPRHDFPQTFPALPPAFCGEHTHADEVNDSHAVE